MRSCIDVEHFSPLLTIFEHTIYNNLEQVFRTNCMNIRFRLFFFYLDWSHTFSLFQFRSFSLWYIVRCRKLRHFSFFLTWIFAFLIWMIFSKRLANTTPLHPGPLRTLLLNMKQIFFNILSKQNLNESWKIKIRLLQTLGDNIDFNKNSNPIMRWSILFRQLILISLALAIYALS